jgi:signal transduction histidine kinase/CheY-like chemotaxis protein
MVKENSEAQNEFIDFERRFIIALSLIAGVMAIVGTIINYSLQFSIVLICIPLLGAVIFGITTWMGVKRIKLHLAKWVVTINSLAIVNLLWLFNYGSSGPAPYFFVVLYSILIFMWSGRTLVYITIFIALNLFGVFMLDLYFPNLTGEYESELTRLIDTYSGVLIYIAIIFVILRLSKHAYIKAYRQAKKSDMLKTAFLANMSHEIRTPLNAILGFSEMMSKEDASTKQRQEYYSIIKENNQQLLHVINDIMDVSKIESGQLNINKTETNLSEMIFSLKSTFRQIIAKQKKPDIEFNIQCPDKTIWVYTDKTRLRQVITNLMNNAIKFTKKGEITLTCEPGENSIRFSVKDSGIGISPEEQKHIFERFYKSGEQKNDVLYGGTGIGLYISDSIVKHLGGQLKVKSEKGKGAEFYFDIPKEAYREEETSTEQNHTELTKADLSNINLMIAEDDMFNQQYFKRLLNHFGIKPKQVFNGEKAVEALKANPDIDIILMDLKMPVMNGHDALKAIRKFNSDVYIIAQTAHAMAGDEAKSREAGFDDYISKPIDPEVLKTKLMKAMKKTQNQKQP